MYVFDLLILPFRLDYASSHTALSVGRAATKGHSGQSEGEDTIRQRAELPIADVCRDGGKSHR